MNTTVRLNSKYQVVIPKAACQAMGVKAGDQLLVLCKADRVVLMPKPKRFGQKMAGLHREIWQGAGGNLKGERDEGRCYLPGPP